MKIQLFLLSTLLISACAQITSVPIDATTGKQKTDEAEGIRYYLPKPYLLVAELPATPQTPQSNPSAATRAGHAAAGGGDTDSSQKKSSSGDQPQTAAPAAPATDTSFAATMATYSIKLIYLPDYSKPMALRIDSGLFGTVSATPTLQDGWMLSGVSGTVDSGGSAALTALAGLATAATGKGAAGAKPSAAVMSYTDAVKVQCNQQQLKSCSDVQILSYGNQVGEGKASFRQTPI
jgi:hypothetical protein